MKPGYLIIIGWALMASHSRPAWSATTRFEQANSSRMIEVTRMYHWHPRTVLKLTCSDSSNQCELLKEGKGLFERKSLTWAQVQALFDTVPQILDTAPYHLRSSHPRIVRIRFKYGPQSFERTIRIGSKSGMTAVFLEEELENFFD